MSTMPNGPYRRLFFHFRPLIQLDHHDHAQVPSRRSASGLIRGGSAAHQRPLTGSDWQRLASSRGPSMFPPQACQDAGGGRGQCLQTSFKREEPKQSNQRPPSTGTSSSSCSRSPRDDESMLMRVCDDAPIQAVRSAPHIKAKH